MYPGGITGYQGKTVGLSVQESSATLQLAATCHLQKMAALRVDSDLGASLAAFPPAALKHMCGKNKKIPARVTRGHPRATRGVRGVRVG